MLLVGCSFWLLQFWNCSALSCTTLNLCQEVVTQIQLPRVVSLPSLQPLEWPTLATGTRPSKIRASSRRGYLLSVHLFTKLPRVPSWLEFGSNGKRFRYGLLSSEFGRRRRVRSRARHWLQLVGCAALFLDASNFGGPDGVGESGVEPRRSLRRRERVKEK